MACVCAFFFVAAFLASFSVHAQSANPQETLNQYLSDLQKNPNDYALREKIIKHVQTMKPVPATPENAREHFVMANTFQKEAKDKRGYELAIKEYKDALLIAPWWPEAYNNMGILQKLAGNYDEAIQSLNLYLLTNPTDARNAQDEIYKIKAAKKMATKESSPAAIAEKKQNEYEVWLKKIDGAQWQSDPSTPILCHDYYIEVYGREIQLGYIITRPTAPCATPNPYLGKAG
jgi:tetratricopeptide (TPR) repeat protein